MNLILSNIFELTNTNQIGLIRAIILLLTGTVVAFWIKNICLEFLKKIHFDNAIDRVGLSGTIKKFESSINISNLIATIIQIFFIVLFAMFFCEAVSLYALSNLLTKIILYYPNIFTSIIIFIISIYTIDFIQKIVIGTKTAKDITYSKFLMKMVDWSIRILAFLAILFQLQIVPQLIVVIFIGFALAISLAIGISVGLAGKEPMSQLLKEIKSSITKFF